MCFILDHDDDKALIAKEDITCYKVVKEIGENVISIYNGFIYKKGVRNPKIKLRRLRRKYSWDDQHFINEGYHSYHKVMYELDDWDLYNGLRWKTFIIPKGAKYFISNNYREYVSSEIIMID